MTKKSLIKKYVRGELNSKELEQFQDLCKKDKDFEKEAELSAFLYAQNKVEQKTALKALLTKKSAKPNKSLQPTIRKNPSRVQKRTFWAIAATIALLFISTLVFRNMLQTPNWQELAEIELSKPYPAPVLTMGEDQEFASDNWQLASRAYREGRFETAILLLEKQAVKTPLNAEQHFYLAVSNLYLNEANLELALSHFKNCQALKPEQYREQINWYQSLIFLKLGNYKEAKAKLQTIVSNSSWKKEVAKKLLKTL